MNHKTAKKVWDALLWDEYLDARVVARRAGLPEGRTAEVIRFAVQFLRDEGFPVVSSCEGKQKGFCKTVSPARIISCCTDLRSRAMAMLTRSDKLMATAAKEWGPSAFEAKAEEFLGFEDEA